MRLTFRPATVLALLVALAAPLPAAAIVQRPSEQSPAATFDTPAPTPTPTPRATPRTSRNDNKKNKDKKNGNKKGGKTTKPVVYALAPAAIALAPGRDTLAIGVPSEEADQVAPLQTAIDKGFFSDAGFSGVTLVAAEDVLDGLRRGEFQIGVVDVMDAAAAWADDPSLQVVAGYRNYAGSDGAYGGSVLVAAPALVADEPSTVSAFTAAYVRALQSLGKDAKARRESGLDPAFAPYDGGFGKLADESGWGELTAYLTDEAGVAPDVAAFVSEDTLNLGQISRGVRANPVSPFGGRPATTELSVGYSAAASPGSPVTIARDAGYFEAAGLTSVTVEDIEQPILGVLQGELDLAVIDKSEAADAVSQGLPVVALAGHRNFEADGAYGGDVLVVSRDVLEGEGPAVEAFLTAYVRALRDLYPAPPDATTFAPFDGGFGSRDQGGGWAELQAYVDDVSGTSTDLGALVDTGPLLRAQTWWGLPADPVGAPPTTPDTTSQENG